MEKEIVCLSCPSGCHIIVKLIDENNYEYMGARCDRGKGYAYSEITDPKRIVTAVVPTDSEELPYLPVKTNQPISKNLIISLLNEIYKQKVKLPIQSGEVIIKNYAHTGVDVVATRTYPITSD